MLVLGIDERYIEKCGSNYKYYLGETMSVTSLAKLHYNRMLSLSFSKSSISDKLMLNYRPSNEVILTDDFVNSNHIGSSSEFLQSAGIIATSAILSENGLIDRQRKFYCVDRFVNVVRDRIRVLSCGLYGDNLYGVLYIPSLRGFFVENDNGELVSPVTYEIKEPCGKDKEFVLEDWFEMDMIKEAVQ